MDMTISAFEVHYDYAVAARAIRMRDMSQSTIYAQATPSGRAKIWNAWGHMVSQVNRIMNLKHYRETASVLTWNGEPITKDKLIKQFLMIFGRRSVE